MNVESSTALLDERIDPTIADDPGADTETRSTAARWRRIIGQVVVGFVAFLVLGNGLILASTAYFRWTSASIAYPVTGIDNFHQVDERLFRGAAPGEAGLRDLAALGVTTVVDLRAEADLSVDDELLDELGITRVHFPIRDGQLPTEEQTAEFLRIVDDAPGAVFVHCGAGVGRTGAMSAYYLNATGQAEGTGAMQRILAVGPPSLEQITFALSTDGGEYRKPGVAVTAMSRVLDGPRRIWHNFT